MINFNIILDHIISKYNYYIVFFIMFFGLFNAINRQILLHKLIGLSIFQTSIIILYLTIGFNKNSTYPVIDFNKKTEIIYNNPLPHALMLTAIVVGVATFAVGLAMVLKINKLENQNNLEQKNAEIFNEPIIQRKN